MAGIPSGASYSQGTFHPAGSDRPQRIGDLVRRLGTGWAGQGIAFTGADRRLPCTLRACWETGYQDPWCILTDLAPQDCSIAWYGVRNWIEHEFRTQKRGFRQWQHTRMTDPARAERLWLPMALCTFMLPAIGDACEQDTSLPLWGNATPTVPPRRTTRLVRLGWLTRLAAHATGRPILGPAGRSLPRSCTLPPVPPPDYLPLKGVPRRTFLPWCSFPPSS